MFARVRLGYASRKAIAAGILTRIRGTGGAGLVPHEVAETLLTRSVSEGVTIDSI